jgi:hypothetical protein
MTMKLTASMMVTPDGSACRQVLDHVFLPIGD